MASGPDVISRWVQEVGKPNPKFLRPSAANVQINPSDDREIFSYGPHFILGKLIGTREKGFVLVNSTRYSHNTSGHQAHISRQLEHAGLKSILLPFASLRGADILTNSIRLVAVEQDDWHKIPHYHKTLAEVPENHRAEAEESSWGDWVYYTEAHVAGQSVFSAEYQYFVPATPEYKRKRAYFISAFDPQESHQHYFLAQLPRGPKPTSVKDALHLLRPPAVLRADEAGLSVVRQGDVFGIPTDLTTKYLKGPGVEIVKRGRLSFKGVPSSHEGTEVIYGWSGETYARGCLYHKPVDVRWDPGPTHKRQKLGDGKTWYQIAKNTVPTGRSWSLVGSID